MSLGFNIGQRVAWHTEHAPMHDAGSVLKAESLPSLVHTNAEGEVEVSSAPIGTITEIANESGTWLRVDFGNGNERVLTEDELVQVVENK